MPQWFASPRSSKSPTTVLTSPASSGRRRGLFNRNKTVVYVADAPVLDPLDTSNYSQPCGAVDSSQNSSGGNLPVQENSKELFLKLKNAIENGVLLAEIKLLVEQDSHVLQEMHDGSSLLHICCSVRSSETDLLEYIVELYPKASAKASKQQGKNKGVTPLHILCLQAAPLSTIQLLVQAYPKCVQKLVGAGGSSPLLLACQAKAGMDVIEHLIKKWPVALLLVNQEGTYPLQFLEEHGDDAEDESTCLFEEDDVEDDRDCGGEQFISAPKTVRQLVIQATADAAFALIDATLNTDNAVVQATIPPAVREHVAEIVPGMMASETNIMQRREWFSTGVMGRQLLCRLVRHEGLQTMLQSNKKAGSILGDLYRFATQSKVATNGTTGPYSKASSTSVLPAATTTTTTTSSPSTDKTSAALPARKPSQSFLDEEDAPPAMPAAKPFAPRHLSAPEIPLALRQEYNKTGAAVGELC